MPNKPAGKKKPAFPKLDDLLEQSQKAMSQIDNAHHIVAMFADDLGVKHVNDPYIRTAMHGVTPPEAPFGE